MASGDEGNIGKVMFLCRGVLRGMSAMAAVYAAALLFLMLCGITPYIVMSGSMEPSIRTGSLCLVYGKETFESITVGDVIAFETEGGDMVTHRVIRIGDKGLITKGDANDVSDGYLITSENFRGKTIMSVPYLGYLHYAVNSEPGKMICLLLCGLILALEIW